MQVMNRWCSFWWEPNVCTSAAVNLFIFHQVLADMPWFLIGWAHWAHWDPGPWPVPLAFHHQHLYIARSLCAHLFSLCLSMIACLKPEFVLPNVISYFCRAQPYLFFLLLCRLKYFAPSMMDIFIIAFKVPSHSGGVNGSIESHCSQTASM